MIFWLQDRARGNPRLFAGLWFMLAEFIMIMIPLLLFFGRTTVDYSSPNSIFFIAAPALSGLAAGALLGHEIIVGGMSGGRAARWGILIVLAAYMFTMILTGLSTSYKEGLFSEFFAGITIYLYAFVWFCIPLLLFGALAGWLLLAITRD